MSADRNDECEGLRETDAGEGEKRTRCAESDGNLTICVIVCSEGTDGGGAGGAAEDQRHVIVSSRQPLFLSTTMAKCADRVWFHIESRTPKTVH